MSRRNERGASMVEFAIMLPLLLLVLFGMIDIGRMFLAQAMVTNGAREGARMAALGLPGDVNARATASMPGINALAGGAPNISTTACPVSPSATAAATVTVTTNGFTWVALGAITGLFPGGAIAPPQPRAMSSMRCAG